MARKLGSAQRLREQPTSAGSASPGRHLFSNISFRTKLIISNAILASLAIIGIASCIISRATLTNDYLAAQLTETVVGESRSVLTETTNLYARDLDRTFGTVTSCSALKSSAA